MQIYNKRDYNHNKRDEINSLLKYLTFSVVITLMPTTVNERIKIIADRLFEGKITRMCTALGVSQAAMSNIVSGRMSKPSFDVINAFVEKANVNADWLITGNGEPFGEKENTPQINYTNGVPYYNVDFLGGFDLVINDQITNPEYLIDFKKYNEADCWCNVTGYSMEPEITHGDIIAMKKIEDFSFLPLGEVYAIVTTNGMRTIKRLGKGDDKEHYNLVPTNKSPEYGIQELPKKMIASIYQVLGCMKRL